MFHPFFLVIPLALIFIPRFRANQNYFPNSFLLNVTFLKDLKSQFESIKCEAGHSHPYSRIWNPIITKFHRNQDAASTFISNKFAELIQNVSDEQSVENLKFVANCLYYDYICGKQYETYNKFQEAHNEQYKKEIPSLKEKYIGMDISKWNQEVYFSHHGLRFSPQKIKTYLEDRDIFDIGSFNGDSCLIFQNYTKKKIYSYDSDQNMIRLYKKNVEANNVPKEQYQLFYNIVTDFIDPNRTVPFTSIDNEVKKLNATPGLIKADVEGGGLHVIKGAINSLKTYHPIIEIAIYHNPDELFGIFDFLKNEIGGYSFEFHCENSLISNFCEFCIFAYPTSLKD